MSSHYNEFLSEIPKNGTLLDAGCGSGRDTLNFKKLGFNVVSIDGSEEMCKIASKYIGDDVLHMQFQDITLEDCFDGIWASASLLHVPSDEIEMVLKQFKKSLKIVRNLAS